MPAASGSIGGNVGSGGRSAPAERTVIASAKPQASVEVDGTMLETPHGNPAAGTGPMVARGTKPSQPPPAGPAGTGAGGGSGLFSTSPPRSEVSEVTQLWGPGQQPRPGMTINQYELIREIGAGGMGTVYLARDLKLGRRSRSRSCSRTTPS
jgi:hypothetical protein